MAEKRFSSYDLEKLLSHESGYSNFCFLNSNGAPAGSYCGLSKFDYLAGIHVLDEITVQDNTLSALDEFIKRYHDKWKFGYISYDVKNEIEKLTSSNEDKMLLPTVHFFVPQIVLVSEGGEIKIINQQNNQEQVMTTTPVELRAEQHKKSVQLKPRFSKKEYLDAVTDLKTHIQQGDIYEVTFCQEFSNTNVHINPFETYVKLNEASRSPMSCFYKSGSNYLISSSPERFLAKRGNKLFSQPIKGTAARSLSREEDEILKEMLVQSEKERAENIMIVDLVRNDLSHIAMQGSVQVDELLGAYSFKKVHQLISTVSCEVKNDTPFSEILRATFPMGSMTGAPKIKAMQLIEEFEKTKRGLFSGAVGYIAPNGDFDFNVVIRSIIYNALNKNVSVQSGGAITIQSDPEQEYEESLLKAQAMMDALR